jgi:hypothetical protein
MLGRNVKYDRGYDRFQNLRTGDSEAAGSLLYDWKETSKQDDPGPCYQCCSPIRIRLLTGRILLYVLKGDYKISRDPTYRSIIQLSPLSQLVPHSIDCAITTHDAFQFVLPGLSRPHGYVGSRCSSRSWRTWWTWR